MFVSVAVVVACGAATMLSTAVVQPDRQGVCKLLRFCCCDALGFCSFGRAALWHSIVELRTKTTILRTTVP